MNRIIWPLVIALLLPGCFLARTQTNAPLDPKQVEAIVPGTTTAKEVVELLGAPSEVVQLGRRSAYRYEHRISKAMTAWLLVVVVGNLDGQADRVWIWFDENHVVSHVGASFDSDEARYALPWSDRE